ncbi:MAG TPA: hypothetical protein VKD72_07600 [Gemmataceae bacterium]|nr:hypothetical protein [Gemmataceae bacterium]
MNAETDQAAFSSERAEAIMKLVFLSITMNPPQAAARIAWWSWRTLCPQKSNPKEPS